MPLPPLEQLIQHEFQQRQRALLRMHLEQQARIRNEL
jgi:hypothetical protein